MENEIRPVIPPVQPQPQTPVVLPPPPLVPAGAWGRFWAITIDSIYIFIISYILYLPLSLITGSPLPSFDQLNHDIKFGITYLIINLIYTVFFIVNRGATFGKDAYGFKVVNHNSTNNLNYPQALIREIIKTAIVLIPIIGGLLYLINGLIIVFSKQKRGLHDLIAKSQVIKVNKPWSLGRQIIMILLPLMIIIGLLIFSTLQRINPAKQFQQSQQSLQNVIQNNQNASNTKTGGVIDTANWKTYTNPEFGFQVKYPNDWSIKENRSLQGLALITTTIVSPSQSTLLDIWVRNGSWSQVEAELKSKSTQVVIGGVEGLVETNATGKTYTLPSIIANQVIQILYVPSTSSPSDEVKTLDQVLSTFKFTK